MTMMQKLQAKRSKKGFTLVELVIVIAVLAILAAIAIPVISTTINSAKMSTLKSEAATVDMLCKEWVNIYKVSLKGITYNGKSPESAKLSDVLKQSDLDMSIVSTRVIGGVSCMIQWNQTDETIFIGGVDSPVEGKEYITLTESTEVTSLCKK